MRKILFISSLIAMFSLMSGCDNEIYISEYDIPTEACVNEDIGPDSRVNIINLGDVGTDKTFNVAWYLSTDKTLDKTDKLLIGGRDRVNGLASKEIKTLDIGNNIIPENVPLIDQYLLSVVDEFNVVDEEVEDNNVFSFPISISSCTATCPGSVPSSGADERVNAVAVAPNGEIFIAGTRSTFSFANDTPDGFLKKLDPTGTTVIWDRPLDHCYWDSTNDLAVTAAGDVVVVGSTRFGSFGSVDARYFVRKYSNSGVLLWERTDPETNAQSNLFSVAIEPQSGDILATGPKTTSTGLLTLVARFSSDGVLRYSQGYDLKNSSMGMAIAANASFTAIVGRYLDQSTSLGESLFAASFNAAGTLRWKDELSHSHFSGVDRPYEAIVTANGAHFFLSETRSTVGSTVFQKPQIARYTPNGIRQWAVVPNLPSSVPERSRAMGMAYLDNSLVIAGKWQTPSNGQSKAYGIQLSPGTGSLLSSNELPVRFGSDFSLTDFAVNPSGTAGYISAKDGLGPLGTPKYSRVVRLPFSQWNNFVP